MFVALSSWIQIFTRRNLMPKASFERVQHDFKRKVNQL